MGWKDIQHDDAAQAEEKQEAFDGLEELETQFAQDMDELHAAFRERAARENQRFADVTDTDYYFCVCFRSQEQMVEFCESVGLNPDEIYIDGKEFAKKIRRAINTPDPQMPRRQSGWKELQDRAMDG